MAHLLPKSGRIAEGQQTLEFQAIHDRYRPRVLRYVRSLVGDGEAEDVTQSVMLKVSNGLPGFRGDASLATWIFRIAKNAALDSLRRKTVKLVAEADTADTEELADANVSQTASGESLEATAIRHQTSACIRGFVERLPDNYRTVMLLSDVEGFRNDEIAVMLGLTLGAVKIRLHRGRERLRQQLQEGCRLEHDEDGGLGCDPKPGGVPMTFRS